jgi:hypothetical protein
VLAATAADAGAAEADTAAADDAEPPEVSNTVKGLYIAALSADIVYAGYFIKGALFGGACPSSLGGALTQLSSSSEEAMHFEQEGLRH